MHNSMEGTRDDYRSPADIREQRRYEIAKACMAKLITKELCDSLNVRTTAKESVRCANVLLEELDKP